MPLPKGLYLGYLKLQSTMEQMYIMVPQAVPNVLPHVKVRDCPNVTRLVESIVRFRHLVEKITSSDVLKMNDDDEYGRGLGVC